MFGLYLYGTPRLFYWIGCELELGIVATSGSDVAFLICASGSPSVLDLSDSGLRLVPGDVLAICLQGTGAATTSVSINGNDS